MEEVGVGVEVHSRPLCVDLDGTLVATDLLYESVFSLIRKKPAAFLMALLQLRSGRASFKEAVAGSVEFDPSLLPYNKEVIAFLREEHERGREIVLATASERAYADSVASHLGFFSQVVATENGENLKGQVKADKLVELFGKGGFDYIGDSGADEYVWREAASSYSVGSRAKKYESFVREFSQVQDLGVIPKAIRVHQWVKNLLLFVPIIMAHQIHEFSKCVSVLVAFLAFCLCSSSVYVLNDLFDLSADRKHPRKRFRPMAAGKLLPQTGILLSCACLCSSLVLSLFLPREFLGILAVYLVTTTAYSLFLKSLVVLDIVILAMLYSVRVLAGGAAADVVVSQWLLAFSMFLFMSLACVKRLSELLMMRAAGEVEAKGRGYHLGDLQQVATLGASSGYMSVLVMALYVTSEDVRILYRYPELLWLICPVLLYWISRVWILAHRGDVHDDPIVFALHDRVSYFVGFLCLIIVLLAI
ncbi:MAG: UbiA family prenyltransferase [Bdellovibrionales bacterium]|nr:UbiA family prenyltransferase [Bdellovibrionales bacterium]